jgi:hypothetical protein
MPQTACAQLAYGSGQAGAVLDSGTLTNGIFAAIVHGFKGAATGLITAVRGIVNKAAYNTTNYSLCSGGISVPATYN